MYTYIYCLCAYEEITSCECSTRAHRGSAESKLSPRAIYLPESAHVMPWINRSWQGFTLSVKSVKWCLGGFPGARAPSVRPSRSQLGEKPISKKKKTPPTKLPLLRADIPFVIGAFVSPPTSKNHQQRNSNSP